MRHHRKNVSLRRISACAFIAAAQVSLSASAADYGLLVIRADGVAVHFSADIADEPDERATGLMRRPDLPRRTGMLFDFGRPREVRMWMKDTLIPLDMLFVDSAGRIAAVAAETVPYSTAVIKAPVPVRYVLEINGGEAARLGIAEGDRLYLP